MNLFVLIIMFYFLAKPRSRGDEPDRKASFCRPWNKTPLTRG